MVKKHIWAAILFDEFHTLIIIDCSLSLPELSQFMYQNITNWVDDDSSNWKKRTTHSWFNLFWGVF